ncbi:MAG: hypothetical protein KatS3mg098_489 [Candidatus Parcubacteria bacterium]|nr:MAG: hypothetical protein KatS3mg098_489 [Candidatus Parcubacteria bacterium]
MKRDFLRKKFSCEKGQLLAEILISLAVLSLLLAAATAAILSVVRNNFESRGNQIATNLVSELSNKISSFAESNWHNIYDLAKGSTNQFYLVSSSSLTSAVSGQESVLANDINAGLVGYWKLDEISGNTAYDFSGYGNNGTLINSPLRTTAYAGRGLSLDGIDDYVSIPGNSSTLQDLTDDGRNFSFAVWFKPSGLPKNGYDGYIFLRAGYHLGLFYTLSTGELRAVIYYYDNTNTVIYSGKNLAVGNWYHIVMTVDEVNNQFKLYLNGSQVGSTASITKPLRDYGTADYRIGGGSPYMSFGIVDEARIYNRVLSSDEIKQLYQSSIYYRYFYVDNVSRDTNGVIESTYNSNNDDPSTQKITSAVVWTNGRKNEISFYLTRSKRNLVFWQKDWSGGSGQEGPITEVNNKYSSASNISAGSSLQITNKSSDGILYSSTFDTQVNGGAAFNSLMWRGTKPAGTNVKFQIASSNSSTGPWNYLGPDGSGSTYYTPNNSNIPVQINLKYHNNHRYFRYKIILSPDSGYTLSPTVDGIVVNWSP